MHTPARRILIGLNVVLIGILAVVTLQPRAGASAEPNRPRGQYVMVSGRIQGPTDNAVYIFDTINQELVAVRWDSSRKQLSGIGYRHVAADAAAGARGR